MLHTPFPALWLGVYYRHTLHSSYIDKAMLNSASQHTLIDTDIGDDVDDAFALALAARLPELRLCGVTTVAGPVARRALLARSLLEAAGKPDVPVVPGSPLMLNGRAGPERCSHCNVVPRESRPVVHEPQAVDLMLRASQEAPLTLIALGPLTNIAQALQRDPTLAKRARLVAMAGKLGFPYPDWNIRCDPEAARVVLASGMPVTLVGMHATMRCKLRPEQMRSLFSSATPLARLLARCVLAWRTWHRRMPILHDPLTVAVAAHPTLVRLSARRCVVSGPLLIAARSGRPNAQVCTGLDLDYFHTLLNECLFEQPTLSVPPLLKRAAGRLV
jgi:inosine-uridine nucleoside N-ribohydrolase